MKSLLPATLASLLFVACAHKPTQVRENNMNVISGMAGALPAITIKPTTVVIDARPVFTYALSHIPGAISLQWTDFSNPDSKFKGELDPDLFGVARHLARLGISPQSDVVVVGLGSKGHGEEGRVAWTLAYLGVQNVRFVGVDYFATKVTTQIPPPRVNAPIWKPALNSRLTATRAELLSALKPKSHKGKSFVVIDVRPEKDYLGLEGFGHTQHVPDMNAINIDWREFFDPNGRANPEIVPRLKGIGITPESRIIVVSAHGVSSAAVAMALQEFGFSRAGIYPGGLEKLLGTN